MSLRLPSTNASAGHRHDGRPAEDVEAQTWRRQAALRRAGDLRAARDLRAGFRRVLPERLAVVFLVAGLAAFFFAIFAMSLLSLFQFDFCPIRIDNSRARKDMGQSLTAR